jgi:Ca2+-binding protein (EF-Hand superfamily)
MSAGFTESEAKEAFTVVDLDQDGMITPSELQHLWKRLGETISDEQLAEIFAKADTDQDGLISVTEFVQLVAN